MVPGEMFAAAGEVVLNKDSKAISLKVANTGDRPIQVGSHYHFAETNAALGTGWTFRREPQCDLSRGNRARFGWFPIQARVWFTDSTRQ